MPAIEEKREKRQNHSRQVVRDFIPAGEELNALEKLRMSRRGGTSRDFVPAAGHEDALPPIGREAAAEEAIQRANRAAKAAMRTDYLEAVEKLRNFTVAQAIDFIDQAPFSVMEMYLVAEQEHGNRKTIMSRYPAPAESRVLAFREALADGAEETTTEEN